MFYKNLFNIILIIIQAERKTNLSNHGKQSEVVIIIQAVIAKFYNHG